MNSGQRQFPGPYALRPVSLSDCALLAEIHALCFADEPWSADAVGQILSMAGAFGALIQSDSQPLGFLLARVVAGEAEILTLAVLPARRRQGIGRRLVFWCLEHARQAGAAMLHLEVAEDNAAAIRLYENEGFRRVGTRPQYYRRKPNRKLAALLFSRQI